MKDKIENHFSGKTVSSSSSSFLQKNSVSKYLMAHCSKKTKERFEMTDYKKNVCIFGWMSACPPAYLLSVNFTNILRWYTENFSGPGGNT